MKKRIIVIASLCMALLPAIPFANAAGAALQEIKQSGTIRGVVTDKSGEPIIGANVSVKGSTNGTITDLDGNFTLNNASGVLLVSFIGYKPQEVAISGDKAYLIQLQEDSEMLDEVVITGYGSQKKASLTSAISQIKGDEAFANKGIANAAVALQGEIPGLTVTRTSTRPGSEGAAFKIRGDISVNGDSSPLIIIDGISGSMDELNAMDASSIENISVLKDASAAIYGARSASGVILVTTKRGKKGKAQISYSGSVSRTIDGIQPPMTNNSQWLDMFYEAQYNDAAAVNPGLSNREDIHNVVNWWIFNSFGGPTLDATDIDPTTGAPMVYRGEPLFNALRSGKTLTLQNGNRVERWDPNVYIMDALYGQATSHKHSLSISGADEKFTYRASLSYADNQSQLKVAEDGEKKYAFRLNADYQATDYLKFETGVSYDRRDINTPSTDVGAGFMDPWFWTIYSENGQAYDTFSGNRNPVGGLTQGGHINNSLATLRGNMKAIYDLSPYVKGLSVSATGAYKLVQREVQTVRKKVQYYDWVGNETGNKQGPGSLSEAISKWENITLGGFVNYDRTFNNIHAVSAMLGMTAEQETSKSVTASRNQGGIYADSDLADLDVWVNGDNNGASGGQSSWGFVSYLARMNYIYADKYSIEVLGRRDGSSKLSKEQRWKNFYSVSGFWRMSQENFLSDVLWLNDLKMRYNYGRTGSVSGIGNYERYAAISTGNAIFGVSPQQHTSLWLGAMTSDQRTWETIDSHNFGFDFAFLSNKLRGSFDYFVKTNTGMFIDVQYPSVLGASAPRTNNGKFRAKGWELALNWNDQIGQVRYNVGASLSDAWSKVMALTNNENVPTEGKNSNRLVGKPRESIYVYQTDGIFQNQQEVDAYYEMFYWNADRTGPKANNILPAPQAAATNTLRPGARKVVDLNGDGAITTEDLYYAGDAAPRMTFGFKLGLDWKGIDFSAFFQGVGKQTILRSGHLSAPWVTNYVMQNSTFMGQMWSPENTSAEYTIASRDNSFNRFNYWNKDVSVQNNQYVRLKSLVVGYTLPQSMISKAGLGKVRFYFSGDDLWEWTKVKDGYDPEYGENSNNTFPFSRLLTFGVDVTF